MARGTPRPARSQRPPQLLRRAALGALATAVALRSGLSARAPTLFTHTNGCGSPLAAHGTAAPLVRRHARKPGEAPGGASVTEGGTPPKAVGVSPVVDDSDFDLEDAPSAPSKSGDPNEKSFDTLMKAADAFATKKERAKRKSRSSSALSLEDDMNGLSLEDDTDLSATMMARARTGKTDVSIQGRLTKWAQETKELITNPTPIQVTYVTIFLASAAFLVVTGVVVFAMGAVRLRGSGADVERRRQMTMQDPYIVRRAQMMDFKRRAMEVEDIRDLQTVYGQPDAVPRPAPPSEQAAPPKLGTSAELSGMKEAISELGLNPTN